jgi:hypothetical protein
VDKKPVKKCCVLTTEKLDKIGGMLELVLLKSPRCLAQETSTSKSSGTKVPKLLKLQPYKATVVHALQPRELASKINFCSWFLQSAHDGQVDPHLIIFFLMKHGFIHTGMFPPKIIGTGVSFVKFLFMTQFQPNQTVQITSS